MLNLRETRAELEEFIKKTKLYIEARSDEMNQIKRDAKELCKYVFIRILTVFLLLCLGLIFLNNYPDNTNPYNF